jgi:hypothetical protein
MEQYKNRKKYRQNTFDTKKNSERRPPDQTPHRLGLGVNTCDVAALLGTPGG